MLYISKVALEDVTHLLLMCPLVVSIWISMLNILKIFSDCNTTFVAAYILDWKMGYKYYRTLPFYIMWGIWKCQNKCIFEIVLWTSIEPTSIYVNISMRLVLGFVRDRWDASKWWRYGVDTQWGFSERYKVTLKWLLNGPQTRFPLILPYFPIGCKWLQTCSNYLVGWHLLIFSRNRMGLQMHYQKLAINIFLVRSSTILSTMKAILGSRKSTIHDFQHGVFWFNLICGFGKSNLLWPYLDMLLLLVCFLICAIRDRLTIL